MSVNPTEQQLIQLIHRHLKENGFPSAAEELERSSLQGVADSPASLLDIYSSWLNDSKKKKRSKSQDQDNEKKSRKKKAGAPLKAVSSPKKSKKTAKTKAGASSPGIKTPKKKLSTSTSELATSPLTIGAASPVAATKKKTDKLRKKTESEKKSIPKKRKNENVPKLKAKKSKAAGGDDLDSDSSLDEEKWMKLALQFTDADIAKMNTINALDSSTPQPKKTRVRKPRAKPPAKADAPIQQDSGTLEQKEKVMENGTKETHTKNSEPKKSSENKPAPVVTSANLRPEQNLNAVEDSLTTSIDETTYELKKKKKKKIELNESKVEGNANAICEDGKEKVRREEKKKKTKVAEEECVGKPAEVKKTTGIVTDGKRDENGEEVKELNENGDADDEETLEPVVPVKKHKKKKKERNNNGDNSVQTAEQNVKEKTAEENPQLVPEEVNNTDQRDEGKKAKKKKVVNELKSEEKVKEDQENAEQIAEEKTTKEAAVGEQNFEQIVKEKKRKKKKKENPDEETIGPIVKEKKRRKKEKADHKETSEQITEEDVTKSCDTEEQPGQTVKVKKKKQKDSPLENSSVTDQPPQLDPDTPSPPTEKKKKKSKLKSAEDPETPAFPVLDTSATQISQTPSTDTHKKRKKSKGTVMKSLDFSSG